jgi:DNA repair exonuclease SbcCD nuclease subunit
MVHGTVDGVTRNVYDTDIIQRAEVINDSWDYIAFGHYHTFEQLAPNAYYSGSLEYTSTTIWSETGRDKGFIEYDLDEHKLAAFHKVQTRDVIELRSIDASDIKVDDLNKMLAMRIGSIPGGHENKIIRLIVENVHRSVQSEIDFAMIRKVRAEALHFDLQLRPPQKGGRTLSGATPGSTRSLEEEWEEFAREYNISPSVDRERLVKLGREYLLRNAPVE